MNWQEKYEQETGKESYGVNGDYTKWLESQLDYRDKAIKEALELLEGKPDYLRYRNEIKAIDLLSKALGEKNE